MTRLVDYFVVCGLRGRELQPDANAGYVGNLPPLSRCYSSHVICHYPDNLDYLPFDEAAIRTQCMPDGLKLTKNLYPRPKFHAMVITRENGSHVYGSVLTFYEPVNNQTSLDSLIALQNEYESNCRFGISPDESLIFDATSDELFASSSLCLVTTLPVIAPLRAYLDQLYSATMEGEPTPLPLESYLYNLLYEVCLPSPGRTLSFVGPLGSLNWYFPGKNDLPLCDYSFRTLFERLGVKNVIKFLTCVLLEQQILLKSSDFYLLMLCAECVTSLLFPFSWPHVFVPILPSSQKGFLDAPVPFIMGLRMDSESINEELDIMNNASLCSVNIDLGIIDIPEEVPALPDHDRITTRLGEVLSQHNVMCPGLQDKLDRNKSPTDTENKKTVIMDAIRCFKSMSEGPQTPPTSIRGLSLAHSSSLTKVTTDHPIVKEIHGIMVRSGSGSGRGKEGVTGTVSPTTGAFELLPSNSHEEMGVANKTGEGEVSGRWDFREEEADVSFNTEVRTVFLNYFVEHFANYEHFSIMPNQTYQQWLKNREQFHNFDKTSFLSDHPINHRPFYSAFLETTKFANLIDQKLISWWDADLTSPNLLLFDKCVDSYRQNHGIPTTPSTGNTPCTPTDFDEVSGISQGAELAPKPHLLKEDESSRGKLFNQPGMFPTLDSTVLNYEAESSTSTTNNVDRKKPSTASMTRKRQDVGNTGAFSHSMFVLQLWRESRSRVKHMLGSSAEVQSNIEANTHIANLCDLLERIWGHGLRKRESKSALWAHLIVFGEHLCHLDTPPMSEKSRTVSNPNVYYPRPQTTPTSTSRDFTKSMNTRLMYDDTSSPQTGRRSLPLSRQKFRSPALKMRIESILKPQPSSFLDDLQIVNNMREIKTDVGRARAWVRLALEKKSLSRHLTELLSNGELCRKRYRHYAFLLTEDEKEQFLYHLLSLSAGDFTCFTTGFLTTSMSYKLLIVGEGKYFGLTTANLYINVGGENRESGVLEVPKGEYQLEFTCPNLGILTCVRLGHDNSGLVRSLMVEMVLVLCITTGQTYRFNCGRPLSKGEDDGSIERVLFGDRVCTKLKGSSSISTLGINDVIPSNTSSGGVGGSVWMRSPRKDNEPKPMLSEIKSSFTNSICRMLKALDNVSKETTREKLLTLMYGADGFIKSLLKVLNFGLKSSRAFQKKNVYIWDIIEKCLEGLPSTLGDVPLHEEVDEERTEEDHLRGDGPTHASSQELLRHFINIVSRINGFSKIGKQEKATILFSIGLRDCHLVTWIQLLTSSTAIEALYDPTSFLRDPELLAYLIQTLKQTKMLNYVVCEPLLVQGL